MEVDFIYNGKHLIVQCNRYDPIGQIFHKFSTKSGRDINYLSFIYNGEGVIDRNLSIDQIANFIDKNQNRMNILVYDINKSMMTTFSTSISDKTYPNTNFQHKVPYTGNNTFTISAPTVNTNQNFVINNQYPYPNNINNGNNVFKYQNQNNNNIINYQNQNNNKNNPIKYHYSNTNNIINNQHPNNNINKINTFNNQFQAVKSIPKQIPINSHSSLPQNNGKPAIFQHLENLNKKYTLLEKEIKQKSDKIKLKVEEMRNRLKNIHQTKITSEQGSFYGEIKNNKRNGLGIGVTKNGEKYEGEYFNNLCDGIGIYYSDKFNHMGEFKNGKANGFGIRKYKDGNLYEGEWLNDDGTGIGIITYEDGVNYIGQVKKLQSIGAGKLMWPNGDFFIGALYEHGRKGLSFYSDEQGLFDGEFKYSKENDDDSEAIGTFYFPNGRQEKRKRIIKGDEAKWEYL